MEDIVLGFIKNFCDAQETFLNGCCYWFAVIMQTRFDAEIYYDIVNNHFVSKIRNKFYDVSGEVCGNYVPWASYQETDPIHFARIERDCIYKK